MRAVREADAQLVFECVQKLICLRAKVFFMLYTSRKKKIRKLQKKGKGKRKSRKKEEGLSRKDSRQYMKRKDSCGALSYGQTYVIHFSLEHVTRRVRSRVRRLASFVQG